MRDDDESKKAQERKRMATRSVNRMDDQIGDVAPSSGHTYHSTHSQLFNTMNSRIVANARFSAQILCFFSGCANKSEIECLDASIALVCFLFSIGRFARYLASHSQHREEDLQPSIECNLLARHIEYKNSLDGYMHLFFVNRWKFGVRYVALQDRIPPRTIPLRSPKESRNECSRS